MLTAQIINREGVAPAPPQGEPNDDHDEVGLSPIAEQMRAWRKLCAEREFQSPDWLLGNTLSWLAFHDPALICQLKGRLSVLWYGIYKHPKRSDPKRSASFAVRPMLVPRPDQTLLDALMDGQLTAIRNGIEIPSSYWFGKHVKHLSDDLRFRRMEVLTAFPAQSAASTPPQAERIANMPPVADAVQSDAEAAPAPDSVTVQGADEAPRKRGRPSKTKEIDTEFERHCREDTCKRSLSDEAQALLNWHVKEHPALPQPAKSTVENNIRDRYEKRRGRNKDMPN